MFFELIKFFVYCALIVILSKYVLVPNLRKLAEALSLKAKTVGNISGLATSMPEFLTIVASSFNGLIDTSIINILSSNIINVIQYVASIVLNKNIQSFKNQAIKVDFILVIFTIIIPILFIFLNIEANIEIVPLFIILYFFFMFLNSNAHNLYLKNEDLILENQIQAEGKWRRNNKSKIIKYVIYLILTGVFLFIIGNALGNTLNVLCNDFNVSQTIVGVLLGGITSIPELITFLESQKHHKKLEKQNILGVVEATNNLLTSNVLNLFIIQSVGILLCKFFPLTL